MQPMLSFKLYSFLLMLPIVAALGVLRSPAAGLLAQRGPPAACSHFPASPFYIHGKFENETYFDEDFNFFESDLLAMAPSQKNFHFLLPILNKLATGKSVRISVLGGSFTSGVLCEEGIFIGKPCAWPDRLLEWLKLAFPAADIEFENLGHGGSTSSVVLAGIGITMVTGRGQRPPDLVILDTLVNDAYEAHQWIDKNISKTHDDFSIVSISYEKLVRSIQALYPQALLMSVFAGCSKCRDMKVVHANVARFYRLPWVDFAALVEGNTLLWEPAPTVDGQPAPHWDAHPTWRSHQALADTISYMLGKTWHDFCVAGAPGKSLRVTQWYPEESLWPAADLDTFSACLRPKSVYQALNPHKKPIVTEGNWTLYEDRPGKPGWISNTTGSKLQFPLDFGPVPRLTIEFLRSYRGMGKALLTMNGRRAFLEGTWKPGHENVSQSYVVNFAANENITMGRKFAEEGVTGFGIPPNSHATLEVELLPPKNVGRLQKFKILTILSC